MLPLPLLSAEPNRLHRAIRLAATIGARTTRLPLNVLPKARNAACGQWLSDRRRIVKIRRPLAQQEHMLMRGSRPIGHAFRHGIGLVPDDVGTEEPAICTQREGEHPGDAEEVFLFQVIDTRPASICACAAGAVCSLLVADPGPAPYAPGCVVTVPNIEKQRPVIPQDAPHLSEHIHQPRHIGVRRFLKADFCRFKALQQMRGDLTLAEETRGRRWRGSGRSGGRLRRAMRGLQARHAGWRRQS